MMVPWKPMIKNDFITYGLLYIESGGKVKCYRFHLNQTTKHFPGQGYILRFGDTLVMGLKCQFNYLQYIKVIFIFVKQNDGILKLGIKFKNSNRRLRANSSIRLGCTKYTNAALIFGFPSAKLRSVHFGSDTFNPNRSKIDVNMNKPVNTSAGNRRPAEYVMFIVGTDGT